MGKKSGPKAPPPPDPVATANAQAAANKEAATAQVQLNNMNQYTPEGSLTYNQIGTWADGTPRFEQTFQYSPEQQALYNQQNQVAQSLGGLALNNIDRVAQSQSQDFNFDGFQPLQTLNYNSQALNGLRTNLNDVGGIQSTYGSGGNIQNSFDQGGALTRNVNPGQMQMGLDYSGLEGINTDFGSTVNQASDAVYNQLASRLNPQYQQLESDMRNRLINSGISENSQAFQREMDNFARQRTDAYNTAANQGVLTGLAAQQQGFGQSLASRQQGVGEINTQGAFANQAQQQQFNQGQANAALNNAAVGQQYQQNLGAAEFNNSAQAQQNQQNAQAAAFGNAAQDQAFSQELAGAGFTNQAIQAGQGQDFANQLAAAQFNNANRQQQIEEATYLRNLPLNDIAALLGTGGGVQNANFQPFAQAGIAAPDYQGAVYNNYNAQMQQYMQAQANRSAGLGSIFGGLGSLGAAAISDKRFKENIKRIGKLANGLATYVFTYVGSTKRQFGVMAQEALNIVPDAVGYTPQGVMYVDYRKVW